MVSDLEIGKYESHESIQIRSRLGMTFYMSSGRTYPIQRK